MLNLRYGDILLISALLDPQGRNPKNRPVVAITTFLPDPLPDDHVLLPWQTPRHPRTGLNKRCASVASWLGVVPREQIIRKVGVAPAKRLLELVVILNRFPQEDLGETDALGGLHRSRIP